MAKVTVVLAHHSPDLLTKPRWVLFKAQLPHPEGLVARPHGHERGYRVQGVRYWRGGVVNEHGDRPAVDVATLRAEVSEG